MLWIVECFYCQLPWERIVEFHLACCLVTINLILEISSLKFSFLDWHSLYFEAWKGIINPLVTPLPIKCKWNFVISSVHWFDLICGPIHAWLAKEILLLSPRNIFNLIFCSTFACTLFAKWFLLSKGDVLLPVFTFCWWVSFSEKETKKERFLVLIGI